MKRDLTMEEIEVFADMFEVPMDSNMILLLIATRLNPNLKIETVE